MSTADMLKNGFPVFWTTGTNTRITMYYTIITTDKDLQAFIQVKYEVMNKSK